MFASTLSTVARLHRRVRFDVINGHWLDPDGCVSIRLGRRLGIPVVLTAMGSDVNLLLEDRRARPRIVGALARADAVTAKSAMLKARIVEQGILPERVAVIRNGVDMCRFTVRDRAASARSLGLPAGERRVLFVGKLAPVKGVRSLLEAAARLVSATDGPSLYLVGEGSERAACERMVRDSGIGSRVRFAGAEHPDRIPLWLGAADVLCLPSLDEGCPNVVLEALASGRPVVASRVGGVPELLSPEAGLMVRAGDATALADALARALARRWDPWTLRRHVLGRSWAHAAEQYCGVYETAIRARAHCTARFQFSRSTHGYCDPTPARPNTRTGIDDGSFEETREAAVVRRLLTGS
jgi:glycosyltransferase involved in cell wall biosynthesis